MSTASITLFSAFLFFCTLTDGCVLLAETVFKVVNEEHDKLEAKKKAKHQNSITGECVAFFRFGLIVILKDFISVIYFKMTQDHRKGDLGQLI